MLLMCLPFSEAKKGSASPKLENQGQDLASGVYGPARKHEAGLGSNRVQVREERVSRAAPPALQGWMGYLRTLAWWEIELRGLESVWEVVLVTKENETIT